MGKKITGCKINSVSMPITTKLRNGNIIEIETGEKNSTPNREWLECVKTAKARREIIELLKEYGGKEKTKYSAIITAEDKVNLVLDITKVFAIIRLNILMLNTSVEDDVAKIEIVLETRKVEKLEKMKSEILKIKGIENIEIKEVEE